jgi:hypothetical protein
MGDLTVDVGVLMSGASIGAPEFSESSRLLMERMEENIVARLVMDESGFIEFQYTQKLGDSFAAFWVRRMADLDRVHYVRRKHLDRGTQTALQECHFDREDCSYYVRTAANSPSKRLVTHDRDYSAPVRKVIKRRLGIAVLTAELAAGIFQP